MVYNKKTTSSGFALLITLVIISVIISIGITLIDLTIKQLRLANTSKDSELAFHAANAGVECARHWRVASSTEFEEGIPNIPIKCFGKDAVNTALTELIAGRGYSHTFEITWGPSNAIRCSEVIMITLSSDPTSAAVTFNGISTIIPGYPVDSKTCISGGRCSIISVRGYNRACANKNDLGTIQREVLLDL